MNQMILEIQIKQEVHDLISSFNFKSLIFFLPIFCPLSIEVIGRKKKNISLWCDVSNFLSVS